MAWVPEDDDRVSIHTFSYWKAHVVGIADHVHPELGYGKLVPLDEVEFVEWPAIMNGKYDGYPPYVLKMCIYGGEYLRVLSVDGGKVEVMTYSHRKAEKFEQKFPSGYHDPEIVFGVDLKDVQFTTYPEELWEEGY